MSSESQRLNEHKDMVSFLKAYSESLVSTGMDMEKVELIQAGRQLALEIQARGQIKPDRYARTMAWVKSHPVLGRLLAIVHVAGPIIGLVGGILGLCAWIRGC